MINDSELSRLAEENFKQYQQACRDHIKHEARELADWSRKQLETLPGNTVAFRDGSGGVQFRESRHD